MSEYRFPNLRWGRRMPLRRLAWDVAWWLMRRVTMRGYTRHQQAAMIDTALGHYRPTRHTPTFTDKLLTASTAESVTVWLWRPL